MAAYLAITPRPKGGWRRLVVGDPLGDLLVGEGDVEAAVVDVDGDLVALADRRDRAALGRLGGDVADHQAAGGAGEAAVGDHRDALAQALADDRRGHLEHLAHAGAADRALVADHDDVAGVDLLVLDRAEALLFGLEDPGRAGLLAALGAGELDHGAFGGEVAAQDRQAAFGLQRVLERAHDFLAGRLGRLCGDLADRLAGDRDRVLVQDRRLRPGA